MSLKFPIYFDHHATTPVDPRVFEAMTPYFCEEFGNPASVVHSFGWRAEAAVERARGQVARLVHADPKEIIFTSGTTESINLAILGYCAPFRGGKNHLIASSIEHRAVLETVRALERGGFEVTLLPVGESGRVDPDDLRRAITDRTILISLMAANNEIGTIQPIREVGKIAKERGVVFHVDAAQAVGKIPIDVGEMGIDLLSLSSHKLYGPKGVGGLYIRSRHPSVRLTPLFHGGGQERGIRPGTLAVPNIVGMGEAHEIAGREMEEDGKRLIGLRQRLFEGLSYKLENVCLNGAIVDRLPGNLNLSFSGVTATDLMMQVREVAISSGSACAAGSSEPSYVIRALGVGEERARSSIRFGLGRFTTGEEIDYAVGKIAEAVVSLRK